MSHDSAPPPPAEANQHPVLVMHRLLMEAYDSAKRKEMAARSSGNAKKIQAAEWEAAERLGDIIAHEQKYGGLYLASKRWAVKHFPESVGHLDDESPTIKEIADTVAALEGGQGVRT
jgi:hypothetical protein